MLFQQRQVWRDFTRYLLMNEGASVQLELYNAPKKYGCTAYIHSLYTDNRARRKGRATQLLQRAERLAALSGRREVFLDWNEADTPRKILQWYERRGYEVRERSLDGTYCLLSKTLQQ
jgi:GNAT superfamily N-acetyltransferase